MTYQLILCEGAWVIVLDGREVMGGSLADVAEARAACRELNELVQCGFSIH